VAVAVVLQGSARRSLCRMSALLGCLAPLVAWSQMALPSPRQNSPSVLLATIHQAMQQRSYTGTLVYSTPEGLFSTRLARFVSGGQVWEHMESLDGPQQRVFRHNDSVHTIWPAQRVVTVERRGATGESLGLPEIDPRLQEQYDVKLLANERVAGRDSIVLLMKPRDEFRFSQRLWADRATGVLLRADVLHPSGKILESASFSNVDLDARVTRDQTLNPAKRMEGYRTVQMLSDATTLDAEGWSSAALPPGFKLTGCVQRPMGDPKAQPDGKPIRVVQAVFSDGLARVSLFIEPLDPAKTRQPLTTHLGATHTLMKARDDRWWITVMGDVPMATLKAFADALLRRP
jgi:sigma-E factor negative regulatory protein RseB